MGRVNVGGWGGRANVGAWAGWGVVAGGAELAGGCADTAGGAVHQEVHVGGIDRPPPAQDVRAVLEK